MSELIDLDFAPGIRADDINTNFKTLEDWLKAERLHAAGWGLITGFDIKVDPKEFTITVSAGKMVNNLGEEIDVPEQKFSAGTMPLIVKKEKIVVPESGSFRLKAYPFSPSKMGNLKYRPPRINEYPDKAEFYMEDKRIGSEVPPMSIEGNNVIVEAGWAGHEISVEYIATENRIDSILIDNDGKYHYEKSVASTNPSHVNLSDYKNMFMLGAICWKSGDEINAEVYDNHRTYRTVYVDQNNELWLRGEKYEKSQIIHFVKPETPKERDIWYDAENNRLMIYRTKDGLLGWIPMNEHTSMPARERKVWDETNFPVDRQTFLFQNEINMRYVPNTNALSIVIDNHPVMSDQFSEITLDDAYENTASGVGFKLVEPLDHDAVVEVIVTHRVRSEPATELFQRAAVFTQEGFDAWDEKTNADKIFDTRSATFVLGEDQLEVFLNGLRMDYKRDFVEALETEDGQIESADTKAHPEQKGTVCHLFKVLRDIVDGDIITFKISKYVWSYDQMQHLIDGIRNNAEKAMIKSERLEKELTALQQNISTKFNELEKRVDEVQAGVKATVSNYMRKTDLIGLPNVEATIKDKLIGSAIEETMPTTSIHPIINCDIDDIINVFYVDGVGSRVLIKDTEYVTQTEGKNLRIVLKDYLIKDSAEIYVSGFRLGVA